MQPNSTPDKIPPRSKIIIRQVPFNSLAAFSITRALDVEQDNVEPGPDPVPQPDEDGKWPSHDFKSDRVVVVSETPDPRDRNDDIYFFIAFDVPLNRISGSSPKEVDNEGDDEEWTPTGCIAFRLMPFFPSHHAPASSGSTTETPSTVSSAEPKTAELKRFYVMPDYRFKKNTSSLSEATPEKTISFEGFTDTDPSIKSVAGALIHTAESFARDRLQVQRMVLETWAPLLPAIKFYRRVGYVRREDYGIWVKQGEVVGGKSRCFEKMLL